MCTCMRIYVYIYTHVYICICSYIHIYMHMNIVRYKYEYMQSLCASQHARCSIWSKADFNIVHTHICIYMYMYTHIHVYIQYSNTSISKFFKVSVLHNMLESVTAEQTFMIYTYIHIFTYTHTYILTIHTYKCIKILKSQRATLYARCSDCNVMLTFIIYTYIYTCKYIHVQTYIYTYNIRV